MRIFAFAIAIGVTASGSALAQSRMVELINDTNVTMSHFYASDSNISAWGPDWLGSSVLVGGESITLNFNDGTDQCLYDFRALFTDGDEVTKFAFNICETGSWRIE